MKNMYKGFTLVELLGVVILLSILVILVYPNVIERIQNQEKKLSEKEEKLLYTATYDYLYSNASYDLGENKCYCIAIKDVKKSDKLYTDIDDELLNDGFVHVQIGENGDVDQTKNSYRILNNVSLCPQACIK